MNGEEKKVLRRKRQTIVAYLKLTDKHLDLLVAGKYLTDEGADKIRSELSNQAKVNRLIEVLSAHCGRRAFSALCELLALGSTSWLKDELVAEVKAERGELKVEEYIDRESSLLVYKEFGTSRRLSESEKRDIQHLVAKKTQCTKEAWRSQLLKTEEALAYENELNNEKDAHLTTLIDEIGGFLKINSARLRTSGKRCSSAAVSLSTVREVTQKGGETDNKGSLLENLSHLVTNLQNLVSAAILERDALLEERNKSLQILSVTEPLAKLDREIELALQDADHRLNECHREVDQYETKVKTLESQLTTNTMKYQRELEQRDITITTLRTHLEKCHDKIRDINEAMENLHQELANTKDELARYRNKAELLEKSRRLGYGYGTSGNQDKVTSQADGEKRRTESRGGTIKTQSTAKKTKKTIKLNKA